MDASFYKKPGSQLGELTTFEFTLSPESPLIRVVEEFKRNPALPGVILLESEQVIGMVSRNRAYEALSRPYGIELFLRQPVFNFYRQNCMQPLVLEESTRIEEAVHMALNRSQENIYEPLIVRFSDGMVRLVDIQSLVLAQSNLLRYASNIIQRQNELNHSLSRTLNLMEVINIILNQIIEMIPCFCGVLLLDEKDQLSIKAIRSREPIIESNRIRFNEELINFLRLVCRSQQPQTIICDEKDIYNFPEGEKNQDLVALGIPIVHQKISQGVLMIFREIQFNEERIDDSPNLKDKQEKYRICPSNDAVFHPEEIELLNNLTGPISTGIRNAQLYLEVQQLAERDPLTGVHNRRGFFDSSNDKVNQARFRGSPLSALMIDIDHFKRVNDLYGHSTGDQVIFAISQIIQKNLRESDLMGRYGGEEFVVLLPNAGLDISAPIAERLRSSIANSPIIIGDCQINIGVSIGVALLDEQCNSLDTLIQHADQALYKAKNEGRNRIRIWRPLEDIQIKRESGLVIDNLAIFENPQPASEVIRAYDETIEGWAKALEMRDRETEGHAQRVTNLTMELARALNIPEPDLSNIRRGALLHDIGKIAIPDDILHKTGELNDDEWEIMRKHPMFAYELISPVSFLQSCVDIPWCHHERWDGAGYPRGLKGKEIPMSARLFAVVDVYDALRSHRCYRPAWEEEKVINYIREQSGKQFDPLVVDIFLKIIEQNSIFNGFSETDENNSYKSSGIPLIQTSYLISNYCSA